jgi:hypothetical protein
MMKNFAPTPTLLLATLLPALAIAAPKKDFCPEPRKDPREQRESLDRRRLEIHVEQYRRLLIGLEISGIKKSDLDALMQRANSEEHQQIQNIVLTLYSVTDCPSVNVLPAMVQDVSSVHTACI